ncbi:MAG: hypothetical protein MRZ79_24845 [Bacteroidia bacterium]|nr:hypothetical protein [Bacteroidia bacterium]
MQKIISLGLNDFRNIFREQILTFIFTLFPLLSLVAGTWLIPMLGEAYPEVIPYYPLILTFLILQVSMGVGFVVAAFFLEEKDQHILDVLKTVPLSSTAFLTYRTSFGMLYMFGFSLLMINATNLIEVSALQSILMSILFTIPAPLISLIMSIFAQNKVEGLAIFKGIDLAMLLPSVAFALDTDWKHAFGIVPVHWTFQYVDAAATRNPVEWVYFSIALIFGAALIALLVWLFRKRIF